MRRNTWVGDERRTAKKIIRGAVSGGFLSCDLLLGLTPAVRFLVQTYCSLASEKKRSEREGNYGPPSSVKIANGVLHLRPLYTSIPRFVGLADNFTFPYLGIEVQSVFPPLVSKLGGPPPPSRHTPGSQICGIFNCGLFIPSLSTCAFIYLMCGDNC